MYECKVALGGHQKRSTSSPLYFKTHYFHDNQIRFGTIKQFLFWFEISHTNHMLNILRRVGLLQKTNHSRPAYLISVGARHLALTPVHHPTHNLYTFQNNHIVRRTLCWSCPLHNSIRDKFQSLFEYVVFGSLKPLFRLDHQVDTSLSLSHTHTKVTTLCHSRKLGRSHTILMYF